MSNLLPHAGAAPAAQRAARRTVFRYSLAALVAAVSFLVIIYAELLILSAAAIWSVSGVFHLGVAGLVGLSVFVMPAAGWAAWRMTRMVVSAERERAAAPPG